jgi:hypothetical protein
MAFITPGTAVAGEVLTAAFWNTQVRDNLNALDAAGANDVGLVHITTVTISAAATTNINNCFSADYDNYEIIWSGFASANIGARMRLRVGGSDNSTANSYFTQTANRDATTAGGTRVTATEWQMPSINSAAGNVMRMTIGRPFLAEATGLTATNTSSAAGVFLEVFSGTHNQATSYDGFSIFTGSANTITGALGIYGWKK